MSCSVIETFEEHGEVLSYWCARGYHAQTIVCFDRHLDFKRLARRRIDRLLAAGDDVAAIAKLNRDIPSRDDESFAYGLDSFVFAAAALKMVRRFIWVMPEPEPLTPAQIAHILWEQLALLPAPGEDVASSFVVTASSARATVAGLTVEATTLSRLGALAGLDERADLDWLGNLNDLDNPAGSDDLAEARVDIDLDFFCDADGRADHTVEELTGALRAAGLLDRVESITYSISSGFLPPEQRHLAVEIAAAVGRPLLPPHARARQAPAPRSMRWLASEQPITPHHIDSVWQAELSHLGGAGWALRSVLESKSGDTRAAVLSYQNATMAGDQAAWAAYSMGLVAMERGDDQTAARWFTAARPELVDTIHCHALILHTLCLCRADKPERALALASRCVEELPLHPSGYRLGAWAARRLDNSARHEAFRHGLALMESRWRTWPVCR